MGRMSNAYLVYVILVALIVTGVSFSRYAVITDPDYFDDVANPIILYVGKDATFNDESVGASPSGMTFSDVKPGDKLIYHFDIRNFNGDEEINNVMLRYRIETDVSPLGDIPFEKKLTPNGNFANDPSGWSILGINQKIVHGYTLTIEWQGDPDGDYGQEEQTVLLIINSEQLP